ncbi:YjbH domain-containing protein [Qingshengfaniella alkalisoli]|uniref:YjbH domain-containing protein n=2 Tax=Qingshengfaniella alkalisoli TaxID=2599296 RepID=A0A5B8J7K9_9RHOB|nr:YjbH domain-containing protein [Qingshengfaniella alkalisoli]
MPAMSQETPRSTTNELGFYGLPGLMDMPTGEVMPDGEIATTISTFGGVTRATLSFQVMPRVSGSFRYSQFKDWDSGGFSTYYDRSFDLRIQLLQESRYVPSVTLGFQDVVGTGIWSGEFLAASKSFGDKVTVTGGLGWGRLGSYGSIGGTGTRPDREVGEGGEFEADQWFRGDYAPFAGIAWRPIPKLTLKAEYSSDDYTTESDDLGIFEKDSPYNFGVEYQLTEDVRLGAYSMYGSEFGFTASVSINPKNPPQGGIRDSAPPPVLPRPSRADRPELYVTDWVESREDRSEVETMTAEALLEQGMELEALSLSAQSATAYMRNAKYRADAQALGRTARVMARVMPSSVEQFTIVQMVDGIRLPGVTFARKDIEYFEVQPDGAEQMLARAQIQQLPLKPEAGDYVDGIYPQFGWEIAPYLRTSLFDPDQPFRADLGVTAGASWRPTAGLLFAGSVNKKVVGNLDKIERESNSELPHVRSDFALYDKEGDPWIDTLYGAYYFQPGDAFYGRMTAGYLERMYAGVSGEVLYAPHDTKWALGAELNYAQQRDYDGGFGLRDYDVVTGHASLYWQFTDDFQAQVDVGRYLAGDYGATLGIERVFENGWRVGAFATKTDVSSEDFGEGSFDKGITMTIPLDWMTGRSTRSASSFTVRPLTRDGGARLSVPGRLYGKVDDGQDYRREEEWGRFWR